MKEINDNLMLVFKETDELKEYMRRKVREEGYYIIPSFTKIGMNILKNIKEEFFMGENSENFELVFLETNEFGIGEFGLAKKSDIDFNRVIEIIDHVRGNTMTKSIKDDFKIKLEKAKALISSTLPIEVIKFLKDII